MVPQPRSVHVLLAILLSACASRTRTSPAPAALAHATKTCIDAFGFTDVTTPDGVRSVVSREAATCIGRAGLNVGRRVELAATLFIPARNLTPKSVWTVCVVDPIGSLWGVHIDAITGEAGSQFYQTHTVCVAMP